MFVSFLYELRRRKVPVGATELIALAGALKQGLHDSSLEGFYQVARALLIHRESHLDAFDQAFAQVFQGASDAGAQLTEELMSWLQEAKQQQRELTPEERALLEQLDADQLEELFRERLKEQTERHDGGSKWIGTGGSSPFGHSGAARAGIRVGGPGGNKSAVRVAQMRAFREYRDDLILDQRQLEVALRKLRAFSREGLERELDLEETIAETAKNAGELEIVTRPPRRPNTRVILMMDVGGSMDPYAFAVSRLFSAAKRASHFKELRTYYFHNCVYGRVFEDARFSKPVELPQLIADCAKHYKLIVVGDALMAPYELTDRVGPAGWYDPQGTEGLVWLMRLAEAYPRCAWLNPELQTPWRGNTIEMVKRVFPMVPLTLEGLGEAVGRLVSHR
jgi:uncharacterized protein with von Willebrand factor type A (vWA) domain